MESKVGKFLNRSQGDHRNQIIFMPLNYQVECWIILGKLAFSFLQTSCQQARIYEQHTMSCYQKLSECRSLNILSSFSVTSPY